MPLVKANTKADPAAARGRERDVSERATTWRRVAPLIGGHEGMGVSDRENTETESRQCEPGRAMRRDTGSIATGADFTSIALQYGNT